MADRSRFRRLYVVEFLHSLGWAAVEGCSSFRGAHQRKRHWEKTCPTFKHRVVRYVPEAKAVPNA